MRATVEGLYDLQNSTTNTTQHICLTLNSNCEINSDHISTVFGGPQFPQTAHRLRFGI